MISAEPFFFPGNEIGCLLVHGFTGTPNEMRRLGEFLAEHGFTVKGVRLAGHGTSPLDMEKTTWKDWFNSVLEGYQELQRLTYKIFPIGLSLGAALSLHLAVHYSVDGVVALSAPAFIKDPRLFFLPIAKHFIRFVKKGPSDFFDPTVPQWHLDYSVYPTRSIEQLLQFLAHMRRELPMVKAPVLFIHSKTDRSVPPENPLYLIQRIGSAEKSIIWIEKSGHVITEDIAREEVFNACLNFIRQHSGPGPSELP
ncbi:MAG: alpha/beta fold hydrolase [Anaerolineae bacterium]|nr:alpha/beta fold hydrolase [Anaerolineae bacterium]MDW8103132.1 alpha/beta fold hydrolase [Anaerolineae bacterium]